MKFWQEVILLMDQSRLRSEFACEASLLVINGMPLRTKLRDFGRQCPEKAPYDEFKNDIFEKRRILKGSRQNLTSMYVI